MLEPSHDDIEKMIQRVTAALSAGVDDKEIRALLVKEGVSDDKAFLIIEAAKLYMN